MSERQERRRTRRVSVSGRGRGQLTSWSPVRLLDISRSGVLLSGSRTLEVSESAELRTAFDIGPLRSMIEVRWLREAGPRSDPGSCVFGARFTSLDEKSSQVLDRFLKSRD